MGKDGRIILCSIMVSELYCFNSNYTLDWNWTFRKHYRAKKRKNDHDTYIGVNLAVDLKWRLEIVETAICKHLRINWTEHLKNIDVLMRA